MTRLISKVKGIWPNGRHGMLYEVEVNGISVGLYPLKDVVKFVPPNADGDIASYDTVYTRIRNKGYKHEGIMRPVLTNTERSALCKSNTIKGLNNTRTKKEQLDKLSSLHVGIYDNL